jgi:hypothetical protein
MPELLEELRALETETFEIERGSGVFILYCVESTAGPGDAVTVPAGAGSSGSAIVLAGRVLTEEKRWLVQPASAVVAISASVHAILTKRQVSSAVAWESSALSLSCMPDSGWAIFD